MLNGAVSLISKGSCWQGVYQCILAAQHFQNHLTIQFSWNDSTVRYTFYKNAFWLLNWGKGWELMLLSVALGMADLCLESLLWISNTADYLYGLSFLFFLGSPFYSEPLNLLPQGSVLGPSLFFFILFLSVISSASNINTAYIMLICYTIAHFLVTSFFFFFLFKGHSHPFK